MSLDDLEMTLVLEAIYLRHGYDFRCYAKASMKRRLKAFAVSQGIKTLSDLIPLIVHNKEMLREIISGISVPVSELFRDPPVHRYLREEIFPLLASFPQIKIWIAGCANGEEAFSIAIALDELGLLDRTQVYATDINLKALERAEEGVFSAEEFDTLQRSYILSGGKNHISDYITHAYGLAKVSDKIRDHVLFTHHNLNGDGVFGTFNLILCRNVMIYFQKELKEKVVTLVTESLERSGYLCLGTKDHAPETLMTEDFDQLSKKLAIYRKKMNL